MKAISIHQPHASLLVTRQPCRCVEVPIEHWRYEDCAAKRMVKRFETRSWPFPPALIGQPIAFHATKTPPPGGEIRQTGDFTWYVGQGVGWMKRGSLATKGTIPLPLGAIVGSGRITASGLITTQEAVENDTAPLDWLVKVYEGGAAVRIPRGIASISDQLPYGDFTPGHYAWQIDDAAPTSERCPWCWGWVTCPVCDGVGRCDPIPVKGAQRIWNWTQP